MRQKLNIHGITIILFFLFCSCLIQNRMTKSSIQKKIRTLSSEQKGNVLFENDLVILYFHKERIIDLLEKERISKVKNLCKLRLLDSYIYSLQNTNEQIEIFKELTHAASTVDFFETNFQRHLIEEFSINSKIAVFNKQTKAFESHYLYKKKGGDNGCCFTGLAFCSGDIFLETRFLSSVLVIEECE